jgi:hypothetical protein
MTSNCQHFPESDDLCFVCPIVFDWKPIERVSHTFATQVTGIWLGMYEHPSDKSVWLSMSGRVGQPFPDLPKKFPDRTSAELWAADTLRLIAMAHNGANDMNTKPDEPTNPDVNQPPPKPKPEPETPSDFVNDPDDDDDDDDFEDPEGDGDDVDE